jgi:hypothetical protein
LFVALGAAYESGNPESVKQANCILPSARTLTQPSHGRLCVFGRATIRSNGECARMGRLTQAHLMRTGQVRTTGLTADEIDEAFRSEVADVLAHALLFARYHGIDLEAEIERKWLVWRDAAPRPEDALPYEQWTVTLTFLLSSRLAGFHHRWQDIDRQRCWKPASGHGTAHS